MSRRKQAKPRSLKRDEEWDEEEEEEEDEDENEGDENVEQSGLEIAEKDDDTLAIKDTDIEEEDEDEEELQRAFSLNSEEFVRDRSQSPLCPDLDNQNSLDSEGLGTGSSSWNSEDGRLGSRKGGEETPSSCATPNSTSFPSEPEVDADGPANADGTAHPAAPYPCQFCERTFPRLSYLKKHEQSHGDQMPYRCSWCARLFKHKRSRDRHVKLHTGDRRYRCSHCEAAFSRSDHLKIHMKTHDTQKPYQCTACSRGYNTAAALTSHMQSHKKHQNNLASQLSKLEDPTEYGRRSASSQETSSPVPMPKSPSPNSTASSKVTKLTKNSIVNSHLKLTCMYCTRDSFTSMQQLQLHVHSMHQAIINGETVLPDSGQRSTDECSLNLLNLEKTKLAELSDDRKHDDVGLLSCNQCTMKFSSITSLKDHFLSIHHRSKSYGAALMMCPICGISCSSAASYAEHYVLQHCERKRPSPTENFEGSNSAKEYMEVEPADLTKHSKSQENNYSAGTLLCGQCGAALKDFESFRQHLAGHLKADQRNGSLQQSSRFHCPKCDAFFQQREDMLAHLTKHFLGQVTKEYACNACSKFYNHPDLLQRHLLDAHAHHLYRCALCRDTFDSRVAIQVHFAVKHSEECQIYHCNACDIANNNDTTRCRDNTVVEPKRNAFRSELEMANHVRSVHAPSASVLNDRSSSNNLVTGPPIASSPGPKCIFCGLECSSDLELQLHLATHTNSLYRCPVCHEGFAVEFLLDRHIAQIHSSDIRAGRENGRMHHRSRSHHDPVTVSESRSLKRGRSPASSNSNNNSLYQRDNNKRMAYSSTSQCELCERGEFGNEAELQAHKKLAHANVKIQNKMSMLSMSCAYCGEVCRSRSELESHTRTQHSTEHEGATGRHKCNICDEVCPTGALLAEHKLQKHCKIQSGDVCVVCRSTLGSEEQFLEHVQGHSLENIDSQQRLDSSTIAHLPAPCVVCRQTLISDLECRMHARHHLRGPLQNSHSSPSPRLKIYNIENQCCICLHEFGDDDFVNLPSNRSLVPNQTLKVCKPCYLKYSQGMPVLNPPYEHAFVEKTAWFPSNDNLWEIAKEKWISEMNYKFDKCNANKIATKDKCQECGVKFESAEEADSHRQEHENASNTYTCIQCQISFSSEAKIQQHVKKEHLSSFEKGPVDVLRCHLCMFDASSPLQLQGHLIEHTFAGCAALSCYICQALFTTTVALQNHMLQEHGLGARPYDCSYCGLKFFFRTELDHHYLKFHPVQEQLDPKNSETLNQETNVTSNDSYSETKVKKETEPNEETEINVVEHDSLNVTLKSEIENEKKERQDENHI